MTEVTVWHDGGCPLCRREIALMRRFDRRGAIEFVDAGSAGTCPVGRDELLARFHAREDGRVLVGAAAFAAMWRAIPVLRPLGLSARNRFVLAALEGAYRGFLRIRPSLQRIARRLGRANVTVARDPVAPGQESVWDYPRPAVAQRTGARILIELGGVVIVDTRRAVRTLETSHPPSYYIPPEDVIEGILVPAAGSSFCEWKGVARYFDVVAGGERRERAAWAYPDPTSSFAMLRNHIAFYAAAMDACSVDGELVVPQPGGFYGGWITSAVAGPFKGIPGSRFW